MQLTSFKTVTQSEMSKGGGATALSGSSYVSITESFSDPSMNSEGRKQDRMSRVLTMSFL